MSNKKKYDPNTGNVASTICEAFAKTVGVKGFGAVIDLKNAECVKTSCQKIVNQDVVGLIKLGVAQNFSFAIVGGNLHKKRGIVGVLSHIENLAISVEYVARSMDEKGFTHSLWGCTIKQGSPARQIFEGAIARVSGVQGSA